MDEQCASHTRQLSCYVQKPEQDPSPEKAKFYSLHCAAAEGNLELVKFLIEYSNFDPDETTPGGVTALHCASFCGRLKVVEYLVNKAKCDPSIQDCDGECPLAYSTYCTLDKVEEVKRPLDHYVREVIGKPTNDHFQVALFLLEKRDNINVLCNPKVLRVLRLQLLICHGESSLSATTVTSLINTLKGGQVSNNEKVIRDELHKCIDIAIHKFQWEYMNILLCAYPECLKNALSSTPTQTQTLVQQVFQEADHRSIMTLLSLEICRPSVELIKEGIERNDLEVVQCLVKQASTQHPLDQQSCSSLLLYVLRHSGFKHGHFEEQLVELLIKFTADMCKGIFIRDSNGNNPLHLALMCDNSLYCIRIIPFLNGVLYQSTPNDKGQLPLHIACHNRYCDIHCKVLRLVSSLPKVDVNKRDCNGNTSLHILCASFDRQNLSAMYECIWYLKMEKKCGTNFKNHKGELPIHVLLKHESHTQYVTAERMIDVIKLCGMNIDVNTQDCDGNTPLHIACETNDVKTVEYLTSKYCCNTNLVNREGCLPLHYAISLSMPSDIIKAVSSRCTHVHTQNNDGLTPLHIACRTEQLHIIRILLHNRCFGHDVGQVSHRYSELNISLLCKDEEDINMLRSVATIQNANGYFDGSSPVHVACAHKNILAVKHLVHSLKCDLSCKDSEGKLPLHVASSYSLDIVKVIVSGRNVEEDVNAVDYLGNTPLHLALIHSCLDIAMYLLLNFSCDISIRNGNKELPLHLASCSNKSLNIVKLVTPRTLTVVHNDFLCNRIGKTPLHVACEAGALDISYYFVENCNQYPHFRHMMRVRDLNGRLPIDYACMHTLELVKIVSRLCTPRDLNKRVSLSSSESKCVSTFDIACYHGSPDIVEFLINEKRCSYDITAFFCATGIFSDPLNDIDASTTSRSNVVVVEYLIAKYGYDPSNLHPKQSYYYDSLFQYVYEMQDLDLIKAFTANAISSINNFDNEGNTPLHYACMYGSIDIVRFLIDRECDQNIFNRKGELALHLSCSGTSKNSLEIVKLLKSNLKAVTNDGDSLLHIACRHSCDDVVRYLIEEARLDLNIVNKEGGSPLHIASGTSLKTVILLQRYCCDINMQDIHGNTPLHIACARFHVGYNYLEYGDIIHCLLNNNSCRADIQNKDGNVALHVMVDTTSLTSYSKSIDHRRTSFTSSSDSEIIDSADSIPFYEPIMPPLGLLQRAAAIEKVINTHSEGINKVNKKGFTPMHCAVMAEDTEFLEALCKSIGLTRGNVLHIACSCRKPQIVSWLVEHGADPTLADRDGNLPQHICFQHKFLDLEILTQLGKFDICRQNKLGDTVVHMACRQANHEYLEKLLIQKYSSIDCTAAFLIQNVDKNTPLHLAAIMSLDHVRLVTTAENLNVQNKDGDTALHLACNSRLKLLNCDLIFYMMRELQCSTEILNNRNESPFHILFQSGLLNAESLLKYIPESMCDIKNVNGETLLHIACRDASITTIYYLIETLDCKPLVTSSSGATTLHFACYRGFINLVKQFSNQNPLAQIIDTSLLPKDSGFVMGDTALHVACRQGHDLCVTTLLKRNHDKSLGTRNLHRELPFHLACRHGVAMVETFVMYNTIFDCNAFDYHGDTPLHIACRNQNPSTEAVILLLVDRFKCKTNLVNKQNELPLHLACYHNSTSVSKLVMNKLLFGLDNDQLSSLASGNTALHTLLQMKPQNSAASRNYLDAVYTLAERMPFLAIPNDEGNQVIHLACRCRTYSVVQYLHEEYGCNSVELPSLLLHEAFKNEDVSEGTLKYAIKYFHSDSNLPNADGDIPLHLAIRKRKSLQSIYSLVKQTTDINVSNYLGNTPFHELYVGHNKAFPSSSVDRLRLGYNNLFDNEDDFTQLLTLVDHAYTISVLNILQHFHTVNFSQQNCMDQTLLHCICSARQYRDLLKILTKEKISPNIQDSNGFTLLHFACQDDREDCVQLLLSMAGVDPSITDSIGQTPLTLATNPRIIRLLIKYGANPQPLYIMHKKFFQAVSESGGNPPPTPVKFLVIGHPSVGKTTLICSLRNELFETVTSVKFEHTAGVVPTKFSSNVYGDVTFYDFAGQPEYYASHDAVLHSSITDIPPIVLILVNLMDTDKRIRDQIHYWLSFIDNRFNTDLNNKAHVIVVCSHADVARRNPSNTIFDNVTSQIRDKQVVLKAIISIDCTRSHSEKMNELRGILKASTNDLRQEGVLNFELYCFYTFLHKEFKESLYVTLADVQNVFDLQNNSPRMSNPLHDLLYRKNSPRVSNPLHLLNSPIIEFCRKLHERGHIHLIEVPTESERGWILLDETPLLTDLLGLLFAPDNFPEHCPLSYSTGVVPLSLFKRFVSDRINCPAAMLLTFLSRMEYCREITDEVVVNSIVRQEGYCETEKYYYFPNLVSLERPQDKWKIDGNVSYKCGWLIQCNSKLNSDFFSPHFIQALSLRLVFAFTTNNATYDCTDIETYEDENENQNKVMDIVIKRMCSVWKNGVYWQESSGVKTIIDIMDQKTLILFMNCQSGSEMSLIQRRSQIISMILKAKNEFCPKTNLFEFFIHPDSVSHPLLEIDTIRKTLFSLPRIEKCVIEGKPYVVNQLDGRVDLQQLLFFEPYVELDGQIVARLYRQEPNALKNQVSENFLCSVAKQICHQYPLLHNMAEELRGSRRLLRSSTSSTDKLSDEAKADRLVQLLKKTFCVYTFQDIRGFFDQLSIFRGRQPPPGMSIGCMCAT